eukprot:scaffold88747_cov69-Phaeocystis_antarctica.AAC.1
MPTTARDAFASLGILAPVLSLDILEPALPHGVSCGLSSVCRVQVAAVRVDRTNQHHISHRTHRLKKRVWGVGHRARDKHDGQTDHLPTSTTNIAHIKGSRAVLGEFRRPARAAARGLRRASALVLSP